MWQHAENSNNVKPAEQEVNGKTIYLRRAFELIPADTEQGTPEHWRYEEKSFNTELLDTYQNIDDINNALVELAELIVGG